MSMLNATNLDHMPFNWAPKHFAHPVPFSNQKPGVSVHTSPFRNRPLGKAEPTQRHPFGGYFFRDIFSVWKKRALQNREMAWCFKVFLGERTNLPNVCGWWFLEIDPIFVSDPKNTLRVSTNIAGRNIQHFDGIYQGQNFRFGDFSMGLKSVAHRRVFHSLLKSVASLKAKNGIAFASVNSISYIFQDTITHRDPCVWYIYIHLVGFFMGSLGIYTRHGWYGS